MAKSTSSAAWVQYADRAIASFLGKPAWRLPAVTAEASRLMLAAGETIPRAAGQSAAARSGPTDRLDAFLLGSRLWAALPSRCPHCTAAAACGDCQTGTTPPVCGPCRAAGCSPSGFMGECDPCRAAFVRDALRQAELSTRHDACPRSGTYCSLAERDALRLAVPGAGDCSMSYTPAFKIRVFVRYGGSGDPRSARYRMWEFSPSELRDATAFGLSAAGSYAIVPDTLSDRGLDALSSQLQSDPAMLLAYCLACLAAGDGLIPPLPAPHVRLDRPYLAAARRRDALRQV